MRMLEPYRESADGRGRFRGIINTGQWEEINYLETSRGQVRGGHYHEQTLELFFIIDGEIDVHLSDARGGDRIVSVTRDDIFVIEPGEVHTFHCKTDCRWINALSRRMNGPDADIKEPAAR